MLNIAIDGPAGAGKSTVARGLAESLKILYLDTGAMYRAAGLYCLSCGRATDDTNGIDEFLDGMDLKVEYRGGAQRTILQGRDVSDEIRQHHISRAASDFSALPAVRIKLVQLQREIASSRDLVLDGRDIGTYVLPNATVKFFLTASAEVRANRRYLELCQKGQTQSLEQILRDIKERDHNDATREFAPLKQADDAILINSDSLSAKEVMDFMLKVVKERI